MADKDNGVRHIGIFDLLKMLLLLYAALVPAGLWVKGAIKSAIRDGVDDGTIVSGKVLEAKTVALRQELLNKYAEGLGPLVSYIASIDATLQEEIGLRADQNNQRLPSSRPRRPVATPTAPNWDEFWRNNLQWPEKHR